MLRGQGHPADAARVVEDFLKKYDSPTARTIGFYELASSLAADSEENLNEALDLASRSLEAAPDEVKPFSLAALGWVYYKKKDYDSAIKFLKRSCESSPTPSSLHRLGMAMLAAQVSRRRPRPPSEGQDGGVARGAPEEDPRTGQDELAHDRNGVARQARAIAALPR